MSKGGDASGCGCHEKGNHPLMTIKRFSAFAALCLVVLTGCTHRQPLHQFAGLTPVFDPMRFWMGHTHSWGVIENRDGSPSEIVTTDCIGTEDGPNALRLHQQLNFSTGKTMIRDWRAITWQPQTICAARRWAKARDRPFSGALCWLPSRAIVCSMCGSPSICMQCPMEHWSTARSSPSSESFWQRSPNNLRMTDNGSTGLSIFSNSF
jgi:hypothetical protein